MGQHRAPSQIAAEIAALFRDLPGAIAATREIAERCEFTLTDLGYRFPTIRCRPARRPTATCAR